jgi:hypothetical protein
MMCWCKSILAVLIIVFVWIPGTTFKILATVAAGLIFILTVSVGCCCSAGKGCNCEGCMGKEHKHAMPEKKPEMKVETKSIPAKKVKKK